MRLRPRRRDTKMLAVIHWKINGKTGHGSVIDSRLAWESIKVMNAKYGPGTHWVVLSK
jgi:hypothetical protein